MIEAARHSKVLGIPDPREPLSDSCEGSILDRFLAQDPQKTAIEAPDELWSYGEVDRISADLARCLSERGAQENGVIGVYAARSATLVIALMGITRSRNAFVILDPAYPLARNRQCISLARPQGFINLLPNDIPGELVQGKFVVNLAPRKTELLRKLSSSASGDSEFARSSPDDLMYVAFTSGSTGVPKAILGSHRPVLHFIKWQQQHFGLDHTQRVSMLSGLSHDPLLRDILMPLCMGATICVPPQSCYAVPNRLFEWMGDSSITLCHLTPTLGGLLLGSNKKSACSALSSLQYAFFGGEALRFSLVETLKQYAPNVKVVNCYGATETPQVMAFHAVTEEELENGQNERLGSFVPIGRGIADAQVLVLDEDLRLCPPEIEGQICIRSPYLAARVLDPKGTPVQVFKPNPYTSDANDRIYPTGDFGIYRADGSVVCLGRKDKQVKILGHRVQLEEIEVALAAEPGLENYELIPETDVFGSTMLALYIVSDSEGKLDLAHLKKRLKEKLPDFMVPQKVVQLRDMPLTPNGKIDLDRLKQTEGQFEKGQRNAEAQCSATDSVSARLLKIFSRATSHPALRAEDDFFQAGLNSLQAITACCAIEEEFGATLSVQDLVDSGNVIRLAARLSGEAAGVLIQRDPIRSSGQPNQQTAAKRDEPHVRLLPRHENVFVGTKNRFLQLLARIAPDAWRVQLHKWRGVQLGQDVSIGYDTIVETAYPWLVRIGSHANIGMRVTILAHFRGMGGLEKGSYSVDIKDYVFIGPHAVILPNVTIGEGAVITAGSVVSTDIPAFVLAHGNPAVPIATCGVALAGETQYSEFLRKLKRI